MIANLKLVDTDLLPQDIVATVNEGPQAALCTAISLFDEIFYGGARGGGKTYGLILAWLYHCEHAKSQGKEGLCRGILFRKSYDELDEVLLTMHAILDPLGAEYRAGARKFTMPCGSTIKLRYMKYDNDCDKYQGHAYSFIAFDELPNWASPLSVDKLRGCLRNAAGVHCVLVATGNPGGAGHNWVKAQYIDVAPPMTEYQRTFAAEFDDPDEEVDSLSQIFIPSLLSDNKPLMENDPKYRIRLKASGPDWLVKAWLNGDWNIVAGGMFDDVWTKKNIVHPFTIPASWTLYRAFDMGFAHPFSLGWWAKSDGTEAFLKDGTRFCPPRGSLIRIHEWYGENGNHKNEGLNMLPKEIAEHGKEIEKAILLGVGRGVGKIEAGPADNEIYRSNREVQVGTSLVKHGGLKFKPADQSPNSRVTGWTELRSLFKAANMPVVEDPAMYVFSNCLEFIRTVPSLQRDPIKIEDVNTHTEDHIGDEARYMAMHVIRKVQMGKVIGN